MTAMPYRSSGASKASISIVAVAVVCLMLPCADAARPLTRTLLQGKAVWKVCRHHKSLGQTLNAWLRTLKVSACVHALTSDVLFRAVRVDPFVTVSGFDAPLIDQDSPGNDISFSDVSRIQQCADICSSLSNCVALDYIASGPSAPTQPSVSLCIPKYALSALQPFGSGNVGALHIKSAPACPSPPTGWTFHPFKDSGWHLPWDFGWHLP